MICQQIPVDTDGFPSDNIIPPLNYDAGLDMYTMTVYFVDPCKFNTLDFWIFSKVAKVKQMILSVVSLQIVGERSLVSEQTDRKLLQYARS